MAEEARQIVFDENAFATMVQSIGLTIPEGTNVFDAYQKACADIAAINAAQSKAAVDLNDPEQMAKFAGAIASAVQAKPVERPPLFEGNKTWFDRPVTLEKIMATPLRQAPNRDLFQEVQEAADCIMLQRQFMKLGQEAPPPFQALKSWQRNFGSDGRLRKAMDTATATEGLEWIPTGFSAQIIESVYLESKVAGLFEHVPMPTSPYNVPMLTGDFIYYLMPESLADDSAKIPGSMVTSGAAVLTARKIAARSMYSTELQEDAAFDMASRLRAKLPAGLARALDEVIVDGDVTAAHQDADVVSAFDRRKAWRGLRIQGMTLTGCHADWSSWAAATASPLSIAAIKAMGVYGADPARMAWIVGPSSGAGMMLDTSVQTMANFGADAAVKVGAIGGYYGRPVIMHGQMRGDLNAVGVYDAATMTKTLILLVYRGGFILGDRRNITVSSKYIDEVDQNQLVITWRGAAVFPYGVAAGSGKVVYNGFNITT